GGRDFEPIFDRVGLACESVHEFVVTSRGAVGRGSARAAGLARRPALDDVTCVGSGGASPYRAYSDPHVWRYFAIVAQILGIFERCRPTRMVRLQKKTPPQRVEFRKFLDENELRIESELKLAAFGG